MEKIMGKANRRAFLRNVVLAGASAGLSPRKIFSQTPEVKRKGGNSRMRIPITMCHGVYIKPQKPLDMEHLNTYFHMAAKMGFESISYDQLAAWFREEGSLPARPIMFDFDHTSKSIRHEIRPVMKELGFKGNLFIYTAPIEEMYSGKLPDFKDRQLMTWDEIGELMDDGWHIGAHTHTHPNLSELSAKDPTGEIIRGELIKNDTILKEKLGIVPKDFAFVGTSWSRIAEREVMKRYRLGRLWIVGSMYNADGAQIRYADLVGVPGEDEKDGGPPFAARYITMESHPFRLPSMEFEYLIYEYDAFQKYLEGSREV
jgi:peptidoglycan/xylan/chitin deacetylase (PgdA/CDA1 family)